MTVSSSNRKGGPYAGNDATVTFSVPFRFLDETHLKVIRTAADGTETVLVLTTDYTVSGTGGATGSVTLTVAPATGETVTILRDVPQTQIADYEEGGSFPAQSHEDALDKLTMMVQQLSEESDRSIRFPASSTASDVTLPTPEAGKTLAWDSSGENLENGLSFSELTDSVAAAEAAQSAAETAQGLSEAARDAAVTAKDETVASQALVDEKILGAFADDAAAEASVTGSVSTGAQYWNTTDNVMRVWDGSTWNEIASGGGEITAPVVATDTSDGVKTNFILPFEPSAKAFILFIVNGVTWKQNEFSFTGTTLTTTSAPEAGDVEIIIMEVTGLEEVAAGTIGAAQIDPTEVNALKALLGVPTRAIGEFFWFSGSTPPAYALALDGQTQSRSGAYADLWAFAQTSGNLAASEGAKLPGQFGPGDGSTTFTLPNLMQLDGLFVRSYDASSGRVFGDYQADAMQRITGSIDVRNHVSPSASEANAVGALEYRDGVGSSFGNISLTSSAAMDEIAFDSANSPGARTADETRPKNVALLPCIVATSGIVSDVPLINAGQTVANVGELQAQVGSLFEFQRAAQNVVHTTTNTYASYPVLAWTSTTPAEIDILTTTINNVAAGNKVKITVGIFYEPTNYQIGFRMTRNGSDLIRGSGGGAEGANTHFVTAYEGTGANYDSTPHYETISFIDDTPDAGSNVYRLVVQGTSSNTYTLHVNRTVNSGTGQGFERGVSSMVLQEIPAYTDYNALAAARAASPTMLDALTQRVGSVAILEYQQPSGTGGGAATTSAWTDYPLNTEKEDPQGIVTLSSNQFTLNTDCHASAFAVLYRTDNTQIRFYNVTDSIVADTGSSHQISGVDAIDGRSTIEALLSSGKTYKIQYYASRNNGANALGNDAAAGVANVFGGVTLRAI